jgi:signal transduction histidine kinase
MMPSKPAAKKGPRKSKAQEGLPSLEESYSRLQQEVESLRRELSEAVEQQRATSEILRVVASSPTDLQPMLDTVAKNAARLSEANDALIHRVVGKSLKRLASYGPLPARLGEGPSTVDRGTFPGRAIVDRQTIHVHDLAAVPADDLRARFMRSLGVRTVLSTPLLREAVGIGAITIRRTEVRPFTDKQIALLKTFADQAVIAIENARLFQERENRNRELSALHDVTVSANQSLEIAPVLQEVVKKITEIFNFDRVFIYLLDSEGEQLIGQARFAKRGEPLRPGFRIHPRGQGIRWKVAETGEPIIFENVNTDPRYQELSHSKSAQRGGGGFFAAFPIKAKGKFLGTIQCGGQEPRKLTPEEVRLIQSMSDQIGVALENINLFEEVRSKTTELERSNSELREALEQQTATSEILEVIASSPTDLQPVLDTVAENAARLCEANDALISIVGDSLKRVAHYGSLPAPLGKATGRSIPARAIRDRQTIHIHDLAAVSEDDHPARLNRSLGVRTILATPLLREGAAIGSITIRRTEVRPFTDKQIALLKTFGDQAVIAIENVRLFQEIKDKSRQLEFANQRLDEASRHKSQFLANVNHELRTPVSAIIGYARLVRRETEGQIAPLQRENLQDLLDNAERLLAQIDSLLDLSKIEAGKMEVHLEPVRVDEVIDGAVSTIEPTLNHESVRLIRKIAPGIPVLNTDREKLRHIILNLLGNAAKFTERGEIKISASQRNGSLKLILSDTGIGIEKEDLGRIFEEFHRGGLSSSRKYRGTGLGLAIVKKFLNLLGGAIAVDSEVGKGSTFTVMLPLDRGERD